MRGFDLRKDWIFFIGALLPLFMAAEAMAQSSGATDFNINSSSIAQRRAGNPADPNNTARNNPGFDPCVSPTGLSFGQKCDGTGLLSKARFGGADNNNADRSGGLFTSTSFGAVTDNMFGAISNTVNCGRDGICGGANAADDNDPTFCGDPAVDTGVTTGLNCGNLRFNPVAEQMLIPQGSNSFHSQNFPLRRFFSLEVISEDKDANGDGLPDFDPFGTPTGSPILKTADRTSFCGDPNVDPKVVTPCQQLPLVFPMIGTGVSADFTFRRPAPVDTTASMNCGKDFHTGAVQTTADHTCAVNGVITETQMETGFPDQHVELGSYFHTTNPDCVRLAAGDTSCAAPSPGSGATSALTNSHDPGSNPPAITVNWAQYMNDPDLSGAIDLSQPTAFSQTMTGSFTFCNPNVWTGCNQSFPKVNAPTGEAQSRGDPNFFVGVDPN